MPCMKTALFSLSLVSALALPWTVRAEPPGDSPVLTPAVAPADRVGATAQRVSTATAAMPTATGSLNLDARGAVANDTEPATGWRERLALLGAALLALLFILRRQAAAQRLGPSYRPPAPPLAHPDASWSPAPRPGFTLSAFDNLPAAHGAAPPTEASVARRVRAGVPRKGAVAVRRGRARPRSAPPLT